LEPRTFREFIAQHRVRHARVGRRIVARVDDVLGALDGLSAAPITTEATKCTEEDWQPQTADEVLARLGLRRIIR
jgi:hypothetical protein